MSKKSWYHLSRDYYDYETIIELLFDKRRKNIAFRPMILDLAKINEELFAGIMEFVSSLDEGIIQGGGLSKFEHIIYSELLETTIILNDMKHVLISFIQSLPRLTMRIIYEKLFRISLLFYGSNDIKDKYAEYQLGDRSLKDNFSFNNIQAKFLEEDNREHQFYRYLSQFMHGTIEGSINNITPRTNRFLELLRIIAGFYEWVILLFCLHFSSYLPIHPTQSRIRIAVEYLHEYRN